MMSSSLFLTTLETARLWLMTAPRPQPLGAAQIDQLRQHFGAAWPDALPAH